MLRDKYKQIKINLDKTKPQPFLNVMSLQQQKIAFHAGTRTECHEKKCLESHKMPLKIKFTEKDAS